MNRLILFLLLFLAIDATAKVFRQGQQIAQEESA
jgi:hypothetical protein